MHFTILTIHPKTDSFAHQAAQIFAETLKEKHQVDLIHLYQDPKGQFAPLVFAEERKPKNDPELRTWREVQIKKTDKIIVCFPIWWNDAPSLFKNRYENIFSAGFAYYYEQGRPHPLLNGKHVEFIASCDAPARMYRFTPLSLKRNWAMKFHITGIKLDKITIIGSFHHQKKNPKKLTQIFKKLKKRAEKIKNEGRIN